MGITQPTIRMSYHLTVFSHCQGNHPQMAKLLSYVQAGEIDDRHYTYFWHPKKTLTLWEPGNLEICGTHHRSTILETRFGFVWFLRY